MQYYGICIPKDFPTECCVLDLLSAAGHSYVYSRSSQPHLGWGWARVNSINALRQYKRLSPADAERRLIAAVKKSIKGRFAIWSDTKTNAPYDIYNSYADAVNALRKVAFQNLIKRGFGDEVAYDYIADEMKQYKIKCFV